jgi:hypothetical protein
MPLTSSECTSLFVFCHSPDCRQGVQKPLSWLIIHNSMPCPSCGAPINLESGDNGLRIQKLAETCASIDASLSKLA